jgi:hypothetical protein
MPVYRTKGVLTGTIEPENVAKADAYLREFDMTEFLDNGLALVVEHIEWKLDADGHNWNVTAFASRPLDTTELKELSSWVSGQNSDGLGESFEQQDFAETQDDSEEDCPDCSGDGWTRELDDDGDDVQVDCERCDGSGILEREDYGMISFDWQTNDCAFERVK